MFSTIGNRCGPEIENEIWLGEKKFTFLKKGKGMPTGWRKPHIMTSVLPALWQIRPITVVY